MVNFKIIWNSKTWTTPPIFVFHQIVLSPASTRYDPLLRFSTDSRKDDAVNLSTDGHFLSSFQEACFRKVVEGLQTYSALLKFVEKVYPNSNAAIKAKTYTPGLINLIKANVSLRIVFIAVSKLNLFIAVAFDLAHCAVSNDKQ